MLAEREDLTVVQAWLTGLNPELGDRVPLRLMRENDLETVAPETVGVARAFLVGGQDRIEWISNQSGPSGRPSGPLFRVVRDVHVCRLHRFGTLRA